ncbi:MAG: uracil-DNA glycosylase [Chloroflexi bacterium]|nr:uracil-DNA glycosylase [Chloroflexota bacterium]
MSESPRRVSSLDALNRRIVACTLCPRLVAHRERMAREKRAAFRDWEYWGKPVPACGDPQARVLMVGLAPGAHGSNRTGRMFTGDGSGDFLTPALHRAGFASQPHSTHRDDGLTLRDLYIVAVAHCAPPDNKPTPGEIAHCRPYLIDHLRLLERLQVIIALGKIGFDGLLVALAESGVELPSPRPRFAHGAEYVIGPYTLIATYHPSRQNTQTKRLTAPMFDAIFARARERLR